MDQKPTLKTLQQCRKQNPTKTPVLSDNFKQKYVQKWPIKVNFRGWRKPHQNWSNWVEKLSLKYAKIWELTGICDGILSSLHNINQNPEIVVALSEYWCSETNTFAFPWGEATITLEDIYVLFGLPVLGETVNLSLVDDSSKNLVRKLEQVKSAMSIGISETDSWINYFSGENDEIEHVGFLAFWLSMFVFPDLNDRTVGSHVFGVAAPLARGVKVALAPAVLACLYRSLTIISKHSSEFGLAKKEVCVSGPFQVVLLWALERFPWLEGSKLAKPLRLGQPRIARWDSVSVKVGLGEIRKGLTSSGGEFCWRPYASKLENWWFKPFHFGVEKLTADVSGDVDDELKSLRVCLQPQKLIGIDCTESYCPQRVRKQFECDQKVHVETAFSSPLESGNVGAVKDENSLVSDHQNPSKESMSVHRTGNSEGIEEEKNDDHEKLVSTSNVVKTELNSDEADVSPEREVLYQNLSIDTTSVQINGINEGIEQDKNHDDDKKQLLTIDTVKSELNSDEEDASPESKALDSQGNDDGTRQNLCQRDEQEQCSEEVVILDSDDEAAAKSECKDAIQSRSSAKKPKRRIGDSADCPLFIFECSRKVVKKSGLSLASAIDVENY